MLEEAYDVFLTTLANKTRLKIINALLERPKTVSELTAELECDQTTISHNLRRLRKCSFVYVEKNGKYRKYYLNKQTVEPLIKLINKHIECYCKPLCLCSKEERKKILKR